MRFKNIFKFPSKTGFTLIELLVVFFVSSVVATAVMANFGDFTSQTEFENEALNIALTIREAQVYGLSGKEVGVDFGVAYGVYFDIDTPNSFVLFSDQDYDNKYDTSEEVDVFAISDSFKINDVCFVTASGSFCESSESYIDALEFIFKRPNPDTGIYFILSSNGSPFGPYAAGYVILERISDGSTKTINVTNTGQIYVN